MRSFISIVAFICALVGGYTIGSSSKKLEYEKGRYQGIRQMKVEYDKLYSANQLNELTITDLQNALKHQIATSVSTEFCKKQIDNVGNKGIEVAGVCTAKLRQCVDYVNYHSNSLGIQTQGEVH